MASSKAVALLAWAGFPPASPPGLDIGVNTAQALRWKAETQIKLKGEALLSEHAPSIASDNDSIHMAYVGQGGTNLWYARCDVRTGGYTNWVVNEQVRINNATVHISGHPAIVLFSGYIVVLYASADKKALNCVYFDGNRWASTHVQSDYPEEYESPVAAVVAGTLHVFVHAKSGQYHLICTGNIVSETAPPLAGADHMLMEMEFRVAGTVVSSLTANGNQLGFVARVPGRPQYASFITASPSVQLYWLTLPSVELEPTGSSPILKDQSATIFALNGTYGFVYLGPGSTQLYYAFADHIDSRTGNMLLQSSATVPGKSDELPAATVFGNQLVLAYKGQSSSNLYLVEGFF